MIHRSAIGMPRGSLMSIGFMSSRPTLNGSNLLADVMIYAINFCVRTDK